MMKYFIYAIAAIHLGCSTSLGEETGFDRQLPAPDSIHIRGQMGEKSKKIKRIFLNQEILNNSMDIQTQFCQN